ncbi:MAG: biotin/lipoyl-containing protein, partial [Bradyrhizobium sp.]
FERDCSVQRNNQKLLEEAPAPNLPEGVRTKLFAAALKLGRTIGYDSAGTVEFIMDQDSDSPYFLEMNTRLQVEHPVTELITGVDLVEWQLLAAAGEKLPLTQDQIRARGHAIEARITAERADLAFQPATGKLSAVDAPHGVRFESGVEAGSQVSLYYDSMLAKLIVHGTDRATALSRLTKGLSEMILLGVPTIQPFLRDASHHPIFAGGRATTRFIETAYPDGWKPNAEEVRSLRAAACVIWAGLDNAEVAAHWVSPWQRRSAIRVTSAVRPAKASLHLVDEYGQIDAEVLVGREGITVELEGASVNLGRPVVEGGAIKLASSSGYPFIARQHGDVVSISREGLSISATIRLRIEMPREHDHLESSGNSIEAPLHGAVSQLHVALGDVVEKGAPVLQMEAMKLIHTLRAPLSGRVGQIRCKVGDTVPAGAILIEITPSEVEEKF